MTNKLIIRLSALLLITPSLKRKKKIITLVPKAAAKYNKLVLPTIATMKAAAMIHISWILCPVKYRSNEIINAMGINKAYKVFTRISSYAY